MSTATTATPMSYERVTPSAPRPAGPWITFMTALLTFGLWPLLRWPAMWKHFVGMDRPRQVSRAAAARLRADDKQRRKIDRALSSMSVIPLMSAAPSVALGVSGLIILMLFGTGARWNEIWQLSYHPGHLVRWPIARTMLQFHSTWVWLLSIGYGCQWFVVRRYVFAVKDLDKALGERSLPRHGGPGAGWVIAAIVLCTLGAWWAIPMVLAGSTQRRYSIVSEFTDSPPAAVRFCATKGCGAKLLESANFCSRCGAAPI